MSDAATAPELRFEEPGAGDEAPRFIGQEETFAVIQRSSSTQIRVSLSRAKNGRWVLSLCVWFSGERGWHPDSRRRGAIIRPEEAEALTAALRRASAEAIARNQRLELKCQAHRR